jgi:protein-disulfide isomerase
MESKDTTEKEIKKLAQPVNIGSDHIRGSVNAPLNIVEYGDYECPYTAMAYPIVKEIMRRFGEKLYFVFRNLPLNEYILMHKVQQKLLRLLQLKINSGKCMTTYLNIIRR